MNPIGAPGAGPRSVSIQGGANVRNGFNGSYQSNVVQSPGKQSQNVNIDLNAGQGPRSQGASQTAQATAPKALPTMEIEYFDINGRALQLRMVAWYCNAPHSNARRSFKEFGERKSKGLYKFGSVPVLNFEDGTQMGQTQAMMRWIALALKGKKGEMLYPGKADPEASFLIDGLCEVSD